MKRYSIKIENDVTVETHVLTDFNELTNKVLTGITNDQTVTVTPLGEPEEIQE